MLLLLIENLDLTQPKDVAIAACALIAFWGQCRLGELLSSAASDLSTASKPARTHFTCSLRSRSAHTLLLPQTKTARAGEKVVLVPQSGILDPIACIESHLTINK